MNQANATTVRKRLLRDAEPTSLAQNELPVATLASIAFSSEDPQHPIENILDGTHGPGATFWASARVDTTETIVVEFDQPQTISRLIYEVEEREFQRTQEIHIEVSCDEGRSYRRLLVQEYAFSPSGATFQREDLRFDVSGVTHLRLMIASAKNGSGTATLTALRLFG